MEPPRHRLWLTYAVWVALLVAVVLVASGSALIWLILRETRVAVDAQQALGATKVSSQVDGFVGEVEALLRASLSLLDSNHLGDADGDLQLELYRLMKQSHAIQELYWIDQHGRERVRASRLGADRLGSGDDLSQAPEFVNARASELWIGEVLYVVNRPRVIMAQRGRRPQSGVLAAQVDLAPLNEIVEGARFGSEGYTYILDRRGNLLAHPDLNEVLRRADGSSRRPVLASVSVTSADEAVEPGALLALDTPAGRPLVARAAELSGTGWWLITEQPRDEAFAPVRRALATTLLILVLAVLAGSALGVVMARRVVRPIRQLAEGADSIGEGRLDHRIKLVRSDELGHLAERFNQMAERLSDSYRLLETRVAERTQDLVGVNAELLAKREEAERSSQAKTRFLAAASHDLRQPMHTLNLLVGVLRRQVVTPEVGKLVASIQASVSAMDALFASLLDISKLDAGISRSVPGDHALSELLRRVEFNYAPEAARKRLRLIVVPSGCTVRTDAALLERVLNNLVSNAIRYTERGKILVGCRRRSGAVELQVWDTGIGIAPSHLPHVFDEFFQIDNPERDRSKGLGLGLAIVKRTLELLGHPFALRSECGRGTCFSIRLPLSDARAPPLMPPRSEALAGRLRVTGAFIVVIDDEGDTRQAMLALCHSWGAHAIAAASAEQCMELLEEHLRNPDLILCDYRLRQRRDGLAAVQWMRARIGQAVPAIIITGDTAASDLRRVADAGLPLLHKPVGADRLLEAIEAVLAAHPIGGGDSQETGSDYINENPADR